MGAIAVIDRMIQSVDLYYPRTDVKERTPDQPQAVEVGLESVRAALPILIEYDFARDGYKISMAGKHWFSPGSDMDPRYVEVAFVPAWAAAGTTDCECEACEAAKADLMLLEKIGRAGA